MSDLPQIYRVLLTHFFDKNCWQNYNEIKTASKISHFRIFFLHFYLFPSFNFLLWGNFHFSGVKNESEQKILGIKGTFFHFQLDRSWLLSQLFLLFIGNICKYLVMKTANHLTIQIFLFLSFFFVCLFHMQQTLILKGEISFVNVSETGFYSLKLVFPSRYNDSLFSS